VGRIWHSIDWLSWSSSAASWELVRRVIACNAVAMASRGARCTPTVGAVGSTISRRAPRATAARTGVLLTIPPSHSSLRSISTGANAPGIVLLARMACDPRDRPQQPRNRQRRDLGPRQGKHVLAVGVRCSDGRRSRDCADAWQDCADRVSQRGEAAGVALRSPRGAVPEPATLSQGDRSPLPPDHCGRKG
jgi:hypothetical protein